MNDFNIPINATNAGELDLILSNLIITDKDNRIISTGFNGFPKGLKDSIERLEDKEFKRAVTLHAEENAILYAKQDLTDCNLYIYGLPPCSHCAAMIIQSGIKNVYYRIPKNYEISEHWKDNLNLAKEISNEVCTSPKDPIFVG